MYDIFVLKNNDVCHDNDNDKSVISIHLRDVRAYINIIGSCKKYFPMKYVLQLPVTSI